MQQIPDIIDIPLEERLIQTKLRAHGLGCFFRCIVAKYDQNRIAGGE